MAGVALKMCNDISFLSLIFENPIGKAVWLYFNLHYS